MDIPLLIALGNTLTHEQMNTPIRENYYPIHEACRIGNLEAVKQMVPHVDTNILSPVGTPIMIAAKEIHVNIIDFLISIIPLEDLMKKDETGKLWLHYLAMHSKQTSTHRLLIRYAIFLTIPDFKKISSLDIIKTNYVNTTDYNNLILHLNFRFPKVFTFSGHGCDTGIEKIVPPGCMYVTLSVCGNDIQYNNTRHFYSIDPTILTNPIKNKQQIEKLLGIPIKIHTEGETYSDVRYTSPLDMCFTPYTSNGKEKFINTAQQSGLHNVYFLNSSSFDCDDPKLKEHMFRFSIIPGITNLPDSTKETIRQRWYTRVLQSYLFETTFRNQKCIFYNIVCRGACSGSEEHVQLRRAKSVKIREDQKMVITLEQLRELYPIVEESKEETLQESKEDVLDNRTRLLEYIENPHLYLKGPKETILSELSSIFPEKELKMLLHSRIIGGKRKSKKNKKIKTRRHKL